jgi:hypothetical protein
MLWLLAAEGDSRPPAFQRPFFLRYLAEIELNGASCDASRAGNQSSGY